MSDTVSIGDVDVHTVWNTVTADDSAVIIDVRTDAEWSYIGIPDLGEAQSKLHLISWQMAPDMRINPAFLSQLTEAGVAKDAQVFFLCRSGVRSLAAAHAAAEVGYTSCFNVAEGFEGLGGPDGRRYGGWIGNQLPVTQQSMND